MSNLLAIATVTATLRQLVDAAIAGAVPGAEVRTARPDGTGTPAPPDRGVNIYLYQTTPNAALRNADLPTRTSDGPLTQRPQAALDLHYLLTFHGNDGDLEPQRLLGAVVRTLHAQPVLTRQRIRSTITNPAFSYLANSDLAEAVESVKFTPLALSLEELSKLWMMFSQTHYILSTAYQASVVLIESQATPEEALPVRDRNIYVVPFHHPVIERVESAAGANRPLVMGSTLRIRGRGLRGDVTRVRIGDSEATPSPSDVTATRIELPLASPPFPAGALRAGVQGVQVVHLQRMGTPALEHRGFESNVAAFVLHPTITPAGATSARVDVQVDPIVGARQRVALLLNERTVTAPAAYSFAVRERGADAHTLQISISGVRAGTYFVRLQIDGAESPLDLDPGSPTFGPTVTIP